MFGAFGQPAQAAPATRCPLCRSPSTGAIGVTGAAPAPAGGLFGASAAPAAAPAPAASAETSVWTGGSRCPVCKQVLRSRPGDRMDVLSHMVSLTVSVDPHPGNPRCIFRTFAYITAPPTRAQRLQSSLEERYIGINSTLWADAFATVRAMSSSTRPRAQIVALPISSWADIDNHLSKAHAAAFEVFKNAVIALREIVPVLPSASPAPSAPSAPAAATGTAPTTPTPGGPRSEASTPRSSKGGADAASSAAVPLIGCAAVDARRVAWRNMLRSAATAAVCVSSATEYDAKGVPVDGAGADNAGAVGSSALVPGGVGALTSRAGTKFSNGGGTHGPVGELRGLLRHTRAVVTPACAALELSVESLCGSGCSTEDFSHGPMCESDVPSARVEALRVRVNQLQADVAAMLAALPTAVGVKRGGPVYSSGYTNVQTHPLLALPLKG